MATFREWHLSRCPLWSAVLLMLFSSVAPNASGQNSSVVTIHPMTPTTTEEISVSIEEGFVMPGYGAVTKAGPVINVNFFLIGCGSVLPPLTTSTLSLGRLAAGTYRIITSVQFACGSELGGVVLGSGPFSRGEHSITVSDSLRDPDYSDMWWNPLESGWGLSVTQHGNGQIFAVWFAYGADRRPTWYVLPGGIWISKTTFSGTVYRTTGPTFAGPFDPVHVSRVVAGDGTLSFSGKNNGTFSYTIDGVRGIKEIVRQPF